MLDPLYIYAIYKQWMELIYYLLVTYSKILVSENFHRIHYMYLVCQHFYSFDLYFARLAQQLIRTQCIIKTYTVSVFVSVTSNPNNTSRYISLIRSQSAS